MINIHSSVPKCGHGVYLATPEEVKSGLAYYCQTCSPVNDRQQETEIRRVVFQRNRYGKSDTKLSNPRKSVCPQCGCEEHFVLKDRRWQCPDCKHIWKGRSDE